MHSHVRATFPSRNRFFNAPSLASLIVLWIISLLHATAAKEFDLHGFIDSKLAAGEKLIVVPPGTYRAAPTYHENLLLKRSIKLYDHRHGRRDDLH